MSDMGKNIVLWLIIAAVLLTVFNKFDVAPQTPELSYSEFLSDVEQGRITSATIQGDKIYAEDTSGNKVTVTRLSSDLALTDRLRDGEVRFEVAPEEKQGFWTQLLIASFPILIILAVAMFFMRQMQGGGGGRGGPMAFGRSKAKLLSEDQIKTTFADVAGVDEAK